MDYVGPVPKFEYFYGITIEEYNNYSKNFNNNWSLREESKKYCTQDCVALYNILFRFNENIFDKFKVNISRYPTLPSLAFGIFRSKI